MRAYNVVIFSGKKPVGSVKGILAANPRNAEQEAIKRYKKHWNLAPSVCLIGLVAESNSATNPPKVGDTVKANA